MSTKDATLMQEANAEEEALRQAAVRSPAAVTLASQPNKQPDVVHAVCLTPAAEVRAESRSMSLSSCIGKREATTYMWTKTQSGVDTQEVCPVGALVWVH